MYVDVCGYMLLCVCVVCPCGVINDNNKFRIFSQSTPSNLNFVSIMYYVHHWGLLCLILKCAFLYYLFYFLFFFHYKIILSQLDMGGQR